MIGTRLATIRTSPADRLRFIALRSDQRDALRVLSSLGRVGSSEEGTKAPDVYQEILSIGKLTDVCWKPTEGQNLALPSLFTQMPDT